MTIWQDFITQQPGALEQPGTNDNALVNISEQQLVLVKGPDATKFLQGQVTCDINSLITDNPIRPSVIGAHCTHKGRMLFSFRAAMLAPDTLILRVHKALRETLLNYLGKYIVFSKAQLIELHTHYQVIGVTGTTACRQLSNLLSATPGTEQAALINPGSDEPGLAIALSADRFELWLPTATAIDYWQQLNPHCQRLAEPYWDYLNIIAGLGEVRPETQSLFIPQMLNFQAIGGGVSFTKGCYTGQEVVARMEYLGKLKRRMYHLALDDHSVVDAGMALYTTASSQSIGTVVYAAVAGDTTHLLAVATVAAVEQDAVYIDEACQKKLHVLSLPYAITKEE